MFSPTVIESKRAPCWKTIPIAFRISLSRSGPAWVMSSPWTRIFPASGTQSPMSNLKMVLYPEPEGPRMTLVCRCCTTKETLLRMGRPSIEKSTFRNSITDSPAQDPEYELRADEVRDEDPDRGDDHRFGRGDADPLGATLRRESLPAGHGRDQDREEDRLDHSDEQIRRRQVLADAVVIGIERDVIGQADESAADDAQRVADDGEHRKRDPESDHPRGHEPLHRIGPERDHRVDLIAGFHGSQLGRDPGRHARRDHDAGEYGPQGAYRGDDHEVSELGFRARLRQLARELDRQRLARDERGEHHDEERSDQREMDLLDDLVLVEGREERRPEHRVAEQRDVLDHLQNAAHPVPDGGDKGFHGASIVRRPEAGR